MQETAPILSAAKHARSVIPIIILLSAESAETHPVKSETMRYTAALPTAPTSNGPLDPGIFQEKILFKNYIFYLTYIICICYITIAIVI